MAGISGNTFLLKTPNDEAIASQEARPNDSDFLDIGGFQSNDLALESTEISTTSQSSSQNSKLLNERGIKTLSISGSGVLQDSAIAKALELNQLTQKLRWFQIVRDDNRKFISRFKINSYALEGAFESAISFTISLNSSSAIFVEDENSVFSSGEDQKFAFDSILRNFKLITTRSDSYIISEVPSSESDRIQSLIAFIAAEDLSSALVITQDSSEDVTLLGSAVPMRFSFPVFFLEKSEIGDRKVSLSDSLGLNINSSVISLPDKIINEKTYLSYFLNTPLSFQENYFVNFKVGE